MALGTADLTLTATNQSILTAASPLVIIKAVVCNTDSSARTVTIYKVPFGGTAGAGTEIVDPTGSGGFTLAPGQTLPLPLSGLVLNTRDSIQGLASVAAVVNFSMGYDAP